MRALLLSMLMVACCIAAAASASSARSSHHAATKNPATSVQRSGPLSRAGVVDGHAATSTTHHKRWQQTVHGVNFGPLRLYVCHERIIRVVYDAPNETADAHGSVSVVADWAVVPFTVSNLSPDLVAVRTTLLSAVVDLRTLAVTFYDMTTGALLLQEDSRSFVPTTDLGAPAYSVEQRWLSPPDELLYGGGQFQNKLLQYRAAPINLIQFNTEAIIPFFYSSRGFGLFWDNPAITHLNPTEEDVPFPANSNTTVFRTSVAGRYYFNAILSTSDNSFGSSCWGWQITLTLQAAGSNQIIPIIDFDNGGNKPQQITGRATLPANTAYTMVFSHYCNKVLSDARVSVRRPGYPYTTIRSNLGYGVDYYLMYGAGSSIKSSSNPAPSTTSHSKHSAAVRKHVPTASKHNRLGAAGGPTPTVFDNVVSLYRLATGTAPLYAKWVFGFWQCQERYHTQDELLSDAYAYRQKKVPVDNIVQDWQYWGNLGWGPHWDHSIYPDPASMVEQVHNLSMQIMVSVWSRYDRNTPFYTNLTAMGGTFDVWADVYNPTVRAIYYDFAKKAMFDIGVDALWLDATEPEGFANINAKVNAGTQSGNRLFNPYSLYATDAIQKGLLHEYPNRRVFSLTRSSYAGQQRTGGAVWSGDVDSTWDTLQRQVAASLNFQLSGMPYWSEDLGGFFRPWDQYSSDGYHEMLTRWFQFGVFTPIFRIHGSGSQTALWRFGNTTFDNLLAMDNLRYRLLPYIYTLGAWVTWHAYTMQRQLIVDFPADAAVVSEMYDEFMFGPALLVAPVVAPGLTERQVYLPTLASGNWTDFWTGELYIAGSVATVAAPLSQIPLCARAGAILPMGPYLQFSSEKSADPLEVRVYVGADGHFTLYEDDGLTRAAEKSAAYTEIAFTYTEATHVLAISAVSGSYPGMLKSRTMNIVVVSSGHGIGIEPCAEPDHVLHYVGKAVTVQL